MPSDRHYTEEEEDTCKSYEEEDTCMPGDRHYTEDFE
jgi:hypothetical protein